MGRLCESVKSEGCHPCDPTALSSHDRHTQYGMVPNTESLSWLYSCRYGYRMVAVRLLPFWSGEYCTKGGVFILANLTLKLKTGNAWDESEENLMIVYSPGYH